MSNLKIGTTGFENQYREELQRKFLERLSRNTQSSDDVTRRDKENCEPPDDKTNTRTGSSDSQLLSNSHLLTVKPYPKSELNSSQPLQHEYNNKDRKRQEIVSNLSKSLIFVNTPQKKSNQEENIHSDDSTQDLLAHVQFKPGPTVWPSKNFNVSNDIDVLKSALKRFGTDNDALVNILCRRSNHQRVEIARAFKAAYGMDLTDEIKSKTSGNLMRLLIALLIPTSVFYARILYEAMNGVNNDEAIIEIMCTKMNYAIKKINDAYLEVHHKSLEQEFTENTSRSFRRLMISLSMADRDESMFIDENSARHDAKRLKEAGVNKWAAEGSVFNRILCTRNIGQLRLIELEYKKITGHTLEQDIRKEFSSPTREGFLAILASAQNRSRYYAVRLNDSMSGFLKDHKTLVRLIVTRCENDMEEIKKEFEINYGKTLKSVVEKSTSGHYRNALYALIGEEMDC